MLLLNYAIIKHCSPTIFIHSLGLTFPSLLTTSVLSFGRNIVNHSKYLEFNGIFGKSEIPALFLGNYLSLRAAGSR